MRKNLINAKRSLFLFAMIVVLGCSTSAFASVTIVINNIDGAGEGFNDPTVAAPVGGNAGTTLGQQRLIAFQHAASIWGATLDSNQTIVIQAAFNPLGAGILGSAGTTFIFRATVSFTNSTPGALSTLKAGGTYNGGAFTSTKPVTIP